jgi:hypothetical protein
MAVGVPLLLGMTRKALLLTMTALALFGGEQLLPWVQADGAPRAHELGGVATQVWRLAANPDDVRFEQRTDMATREVTWWSRDGGNILTRYGDVASARVSPRRGSSPRSTFGQVTFSFG